MSTYRVWAPYAAEVELLTGDPSAPDHHPMTEGEGGWFESGVERRTGERYAFRLRATAGHGAPEGASESDPGEWTMPLPDPRSQRQPDGPHGFSQVVDLDGYGWGSADWTGRILPGGQRQFQFAAAGDIEPIRHLAHQRQQRGEGIGLQRIMHPQPSRHGGAQFRHPPPDHARGIDE